MARKPKSIQDKKQVDWKGGFKAIRFLPRFFKEIYTSGPFIFIFNLLCRLINAFTPVIILWVGKLIIDEIIFQAGSSGDKNLSTLWWYIGIELAIVVFSDLINRMVNLTDGLIGDLYSNHSSVEIIKKTRDLSISQLEDSEIYDKLERARTQTNGRVGLMTNILSQIQSLIMVFSLIAALIYFEPWLIVLLVISIIPSFINELNFSSQRYSIARSWTSERRELDYLRYIGANSNTAKEIKLFNLIDFISDRFKKLSHQYYLINQKLAVRRTILGTLFNLLGTLSYYGAYILIILRAVAGVITIGDLTFLSGSFSKLRSTLQSMFGRLTRISESALYLRDYFDFIDLSTDNSIVTQLSMPSIIKTGFEFKSVSFSYPGSKEKVLKDVNFHLNVGEKMAFVGQNGAGKTTLIKLLLRFYKPDEGQILLDGRDIQDFDEAEYQSMFGVIFQDFIKYDFNVRENIAVGDINQIDDQSAIQAAAELSLADEFISEMSEGYQQQLGRRFTKGKDLSGGQWQKIALARAYIRDASVMILDEPTSALDAKAEYEAFQRFMGLTKDKTSIIISHRFSTVRMADRIIVLENGTVTEEGTHEALMKNEALYAELFTLQAAGYQ